MNQITKSDLRIMRRRYTRAMIAAGVLNDGDRLHFQEGSYTYGYAYRVHRIPAGKSGHWNPPIGDAFLGMTKREAFETMATIARSVEDTIQVSPHCSAPTPPTWETLEEQVNAVIA